MAQFVAFNKLEEIYAGSSSSSRLDAPPPHSRSSRFHRGHAHALCWPATTIILSISGKNKRNTACPTGLNRLIRSPLDLRLVFISVWTWTLKGSLQDTTSYLRQHNRRSLKMGSVPAISVLILGIVVPGLAGYIEVYMHAFPILCPGVAMLVSGSYSWLWSELECSLCPKGKNNPLQHVYYLCVLGMRYIALVIWIGLFASLAHLTLWYVTLLEIIPYIFCRLDLILIFYI